MHCDGGAAIIPYPCPKCGAQATAHVGERGFRWSASHVCAGGCGYAMAEDGIGRIEGEYRGAVLQQSGTWQVWMLLNPMTRVKAIHLLREMLDLSLAAVSKRTSESPALAWEGTSGEASLFAKEFQRAGVAVEIRPRGRDA